jgi:hypothetical protein
MPVLICRIDMVLFSSFDHAGSDDATLFSDKHDHKAIHYDPLISEGIHLKGLSSASPPPPLPFRP